MVEEIEAPKVLSKQEYIKQVKDNYPLQLSSYKNESYYSQLLQPTQFYSIVDQNADAIYVEYFTEYDILYGGKQTSTLSRDLFKQVTSILDIYFQYPYKLDQFYKKATTDDERAKVKDGMLNNFYTAMVQGLNLFKTKYVVIPPKTEPGIEDIKETDAVGAILTMPNTGARFITAAKDDPQGILKNIAFWLADAQNEANYKGNSAEFAAAQITKLVLDVNKLYRGLFGYDLTLRSPIDKNASDYIEVAGAVLLFGGLIKTVISKIFSEIISKISFAEFLETIAKAIAKFNISGTTTELIEIESKAATDTLKNMAEIAGKASDAETATITSYWRSASQGDKSAITKLKDALSKAFSKVPSLENTNAFIEYAKKYPEEAASVLVNNAETFVKMSPGDKAKILEELANTKATQNQVVDLLDQIGIKVLVNNKAQSSIISKIAKEWRLILGITGGFIGTSIFIEWAGAESPEALQFSFTDVLNKKDYELARKNILARKAIIDVVDPIENTIHVLLPIISNTIFAKYQGNKNQLGQDMIRFNTATNTQTFSNSVIDDYTTITEPETPIIIKLGQIQISGNPEMANVYVNDKLQVKGINVTSNFTPMLITALPVDIYTIIITKQGYSDVIEEIDLGEGDMVNLTYNLIPLTKEEKDKLAGKGTIKISANSPNTKIYVDGSQYYDIAPHLYSLDIGTHTFQLTAKGYETLIFRQEIFEGDELNIEKELVKIEIPEEPEVPEEPKEPEKPETITGYIYFDSKPQGASIYLDGVYTFAQTPHLLQVQEGSHNIEYNLKDYHNEIFSVNVIENQTTNVIKDLKLRSGVEKPEEPIEDTEEPEVPEDEEEITPIQTAWEYVITSNPAGANVYVNGNNTFKKTPASILLDQNADYTILVDLFGYSPGIATIHTDPF